MNGAQLPHNRVMNRAFAEKGRDDVVMIEVFPISDGELLQLTFESKNSDWRQGVWLKTDDYLVVNDVRCPSASIWQETAPSQVRIECHTQAGCLHLYNIWDKGAGRSSQMWTSGMLVEELPSGRRYRCNDIGFESGFDKLVFRIERVDR